MDESERGYLRIGELSSRVGVSPELLRAWERRYSLLRPSRSSGGFRLYSDADQKRVRLMQEHLDRGLAAAEAARQAISGPTESIASPAIDSAEDSVHALKGALDDFDQEGADRVIDRALASFSLDDTLTKVLLPYLLDLGERWVSGEVSVAQEHFASNLVRARLMNLARGWDGGYGPRALLACPEGELHDLALIMFGLALNKRGWRITFLGANTPGTTIVEAAEHTSPDATVIATSSPQHLGEIIPSLADIAKNGRVVIAGRGASAVIAKKCGAELVQSDPVSAAEEIARSLPWTRG